MGVSEIGSHSTRSHRVHRSGYKHDIKSGILGDIVTIIGSNGYGDFSFSPKKRIKLREAIKLLKTIV